MLLPLLFSELHFFNTLLLHMNIMKTIKSQYSEDENLADCYTPNIFLFKFNKFAKR